MNSNPIDRRAAAVARRGKFLTITFAALGGALLAAFACGPFFPNRFLDMGDDAVLAAPNASFAGELQRMKLLPSPEPSRAAENSDNPPPPVPAPPAARDDMRDATLDAELADLRAALAKNAALTAAERDDLVTRHADERAKLANEPDRRDYVSPEERAQPPRVITVLPELPAEFVAYFDGAIAWKRGDTNAALAAWERVLALPADERRYKSVWAAYMLGKARVADDGDAAAEHFRQMRALAKAGFRDRLDLAASSLGWEAKAHYEQGENYQAALLYLEEGARRGGVDVTSLAWVAGRALRDGDELDQFARHPQLVRILTAHLLEGDTWRYGTGRPASVEPWLAAVEAAKVKDVEAAEMLALAAYRGGDFARTRRWLKLAPRTPIAQWLQAKLLLRDGKLNEAAALLARLAPLFPLADDRENAGAPVSLKDNLYVPGDAYESFSAAKQLHGELATLRLARREFTASLDTFLQADLWDDAAYVAERVLMLDELKRYVDANHPEPDMPFPRNLTSSQSITIQLRGLLARRLFRENRGDEAEEYYLRAPDSQRDLLAEDYHHMITALRAAWDESQPRAARIAAFISAGRILHTNGLNLIGTELEPDYFIHGGSHVFGITPTSRERGSAYEPYADSTAEKFEPRPKPLRLAGPTAEERRRAAVEPADPPQRFHYRYIAADLLWRAAELLPDQTEEKACVLCEAGTMLKFTHPQAADRYYKALVRKCGNTAIGKLADEVRWFPYLDADGHLTPDQPKRRKPLAATQVPPELPPADAGVNN
ncbi:MAG: hypothetical protein HY301_09860 [Verrucomicrobia bacterium]|nr:hypothetical protein [Verrucomicrobiota bacterium]